MTTFSNDGLDKAFKSFKNLLFITKPSGFPSVFLLSDAKYVRPWFD